MSTPHVVVEHFTNHENQGDFDFWCVAHLDGPVLVDGVECHEDGPCHPDCPDCPVSCPIEPCPWGEVDP